MERKRLETQLPEEDLLSMHNYQCKRDSRFNHAVLEVFAEREAGILAVAPKQNMDIVREHLAECDSCREYFDSNLDLGENLGARVAVYRGTF